MRKNIHPKWYPNAKVTCACGHSFIVGSTRPEIRVEICSACHPFFTGEMRYVDTLGRVEKFQAKQKLAKEIGWKKKSKSKKTKKERPQTLKEMLRKKG